MKLTKNKVLVAALAVCLVAILSTGSLAWFSASKSVENKFLVADSDDTDPEDIFSLDLYEKTPEEDEDRDGHEYGDILPGDSLVKEPHVKNTGYYDQYIRVIVTISDATAWINAVGLDFDMDTVFVGFDESKWAPIEKTISGETDTVTYVLYYTEILGSEEEIVLFDHVNIPTSLTQEQAAAFGGDFTINVKAQAVQTRNVGSNAYEAFQTVGMAP